MKKLFLTVITITAVTLSLLMQIACKKNNDCTLPAASGIKYANVSSSSVSISWAAVSGAFNYQVEILDSLTNVSVESKLAILPEISFSNLTSNKAYKIKIRARCSKDQLSTNIAMGNFHTSKDLCNLPAVINLTTIVKPTTVTVNFTPIASVKSYKVSIYTNVVPKVLIKSQIVTQIPVLFTGLLPGTSYLVEVAAICPDDMPSPNIASRKFVTPLIIEDDIVMFAGSDKQFATPCTVLGNSKTPITTIPYTYNLTVSGIHFIRIKDVIGNLKCEFRLGNLLDPMSGAMKFSYKESCPDTDALTEEPKRDPVTNEIYFTLGGTNKMIINVSSTDFTVTLPAGYQLFID